MAASGLVRRWIAIIKNITRLPSVTSWFTSRNISNGGCGAFFVVTLNKLLNKQLSCRWVETIWPLRHAMECCLILYLGMFNWILRNRSQTILKGSLWLPMFKIDWLASSHGTKSVNSRKWQYFTKFNKTVENLIMANSGSSSQLMTFSNHIVIL